MQRIENLTGLRAVAALWVVLFHVNVSVGPLHQRLGAVVEHGDMGVDLFFVLSGFVLSLVYADKLPERFEWPWYRRFLSRRYAKIYPIHLLTFAAMVLLIVTTISLGYKPVATGDNTPWSALCNVFLLHAYGVTHGLSWNTPSWSVSAEWFAYSLLFTPMVFLLRSVKTVYVAGLCVALLCAVNGVSEHFGKSWTGFTVNGVVRIAPEFFCGYLLYRLLRRGVPRGGDLWTAAGLAGLGCAAYLRSEVSWWLLPVLMVLLTGLHRGGRLSNAVFGNRMAVVIGDASYSIYLIQTFVIIAANQILRRVRTPPTQQASVVAVALIETGVVALCGLAMFRYIEEPLRQTVLRALAAKTKNPEVLPDASLGGRVSDTQVSSTIG